MDLLRLLQLEPDLLCPGDPTYPNSNQIFVGLGVAVASQARAYRLNDRFDTEVADDTIGDAQVAVTY